MWDPMSEETFSSDGENSVSIYDVVDSVAANKKLIFERFLKYERRKSISPRFMVVGPGRCGKDTCALFLAQTLKQQFDGSTSWSVKELIAHSLRQSVLSCYADRHNCRKYWFDFCNRLRQIDPHMLIKMTLAFSDILIGTRDKQELANGFEVHRPNYVIWPVRDVPHDPTLEFDQEDVRRLCSEYGASFVLVDNQSDIPAFHQNLRQALPYLSCNE